MLRTFILSLTAFLLTSACSDAEQKTGISKKTAMQYAKAEIKVPTIQCNSCATNVENAVLDLEGVDEAEVNLKAKVVSVSFDDAKVVVADLERAIAKAGYDANETLRDSTAYAALDACCKIPEDGGGHAH